MARIEWSTTFWWMRDELHLSGTELECYAVIYSLSLGDNWYNAGVKNLVQFLGKSEPTIISALKSLTEKKLIVKEPVVINNTKRNYYKATRTLSDDGTTLKNLSTTTLKNLSTTTLKNLSPNINIVNNKKNISNDISKKGQKQKVFVKPTIEDVADYIQKMGYKSSAEEFFNYHESRGWVVGRNPMKDWKAAVRYWESKEKKISVYDISPEDKDVEVRYKTYMREKFPDIEKAQKPLCFTDYRDLVHDFGVDAVTDKLDHIVTYFGRYKSCDIYRLIKSWLSEDGRD